ncbi:MAG: CerR family C-terminal domain-containing protein [Isosphaeraceae bacterium]
MREILSRLWPGIDGRRLDATCFSVIGQCLHYRLARTVSVRLIGESAWQALDADYLCDHITSFCLAALGQGEALPRRFPPEVSDADASADPAACGSVQT